MTTAQTEQARNMITRCRRLRGEARPEAVLRSELASRLRQVFPDTADQSWIDHYTEGAEAATRIATAAGATACRFIDTLIRSTVIEYEPDLRRGPRWDQGYRQVEEYAAGAVRAGVPVSVVRGILSDTVEWHVYDVQIADSVTPEDCTPDSVILNEIESFTAETPDDETAQRLLQFLRKHLAREQSRQLNSQFIAGDLGLESPAYRRHTDALLALVQEGRAADASIALATDLWSRFVDYLAQTEGEFRTQSYVDEAYIAILARLLCANILEGRACLSSEAELAEILTGELFETRFHLKNMVEQDYFGWMLRPEYLPRVLPVAMEIQHDLYAYDFSAVREEDLFGRLMSQLARRAQRKLLGQEWTPQWIARALAEKCITMIPTGEVPCLIDMCCGSGAIMAEVIKAARAATPEIGFCDLASVVTGFDIDPLAVMLAKTTWVVVLADEIRGSGVQTTVPVYHADSLFAVAPTTHRIPMPGESEEIVVELDGQRVSIPASLVSPDRGSMFDDIIDWCYDEARSAQEVGSTEAVTLERAEQLVANLVRQNRLELTEEELRKVSDASYALASRMSELAVGNRNGIWAFILRNTYRPGLLAGQFNGLVSNPPWLAMSQIAENPYKEQLSERALSYGINPSGAAHLHLELATTHLLHAVDRYLKPDAAVACLVPGTVLNGQHHAKLRDSAFLSSDRPVPYELNHVWEIAPGTFKVRSLALIGVKRAAPCRVCRDVPAGAIAAPEGIEDTTLAVRRLGTRTAWVLGGNASVVATGTYEVPPQGADLMPRLAVVVDVGSERGSEWRVRTPRRQDASYFAVKDAKKLKGAAFNGSVAPCFIHRMAQSLNLLPFVLDDNFTRITIPARRDDDEEWEIMDAAEIRTAGFTQTARRFQRIDRAMRTAGIRKPLAEYINERRKLEKQVVAENGFLVFAPAGGSVVCGAMLGIAACSDLVIDQTLYWAVAATEDEAWYRVGLLNTDAVTQAIADFNPEGEFGGRHLHTLPHRVTPIYDDASSDHAEVARLAKVLSQRALPLIAADRNIADPAKQIARRRRRLRIALKELPEFDALEDVAAAVLGR